MRIFVKRSKQNKDSPLAADIIKKHRKNILDSISAWTGEKKYIIDDLLITIDERCRDLRLVTLDSESVTTLKISAYITTLVMNYIYTGQFRKEK